MCVFCANGIYETSNSVLNDFKPIIYTTPLNFGEIFFSAELVFLYLIRLNYCYRRGFFKFISFNFQKKKRKEEKNRKLKAKWIKFRNFFFLFLINTNENSGPDQTPPPRLLIIYDNFFAF